MLKGNLKHQNTIKGNFTYENKYLKLLIIYLINYCETNLIIYLLFQ